MRLGVDRKGPSAPVASQLGKYDVLTSTGTPILSTSNDIESSPAWMLDTFTSSSGLGWGPLSVSQPQSVPSGLEHFCGADSFSGGCTVRVTCCQSSGPSATSGWDHSCSLTYQQAEVASHSCTPF